MAITQWMRHTGSFIRRARKKTNFLEAKKHAEIHCKPKRYANGNLGHCKGSDFALKAISRSIDGLDLDLVGS